MPDIKYTIVDNFDHIFDEKGNSFLAIRKLYWGEDSNKVKLDIRKWFTGTDGQDGIGKGFSFLTEEGPNNLTKTLLDLGYGHTVEVLESIKGRKDFKSSLNKVLGKDDEHYDNSVAEDNLYVPGSELFDYEED